MADETTSSGYVFTLAGHQGEITTEELAEELAPYLGGGPGGAVAWSTIVDKPAVIAAGATQADARTAIGAGTSSLALGSTGSTAAAGNHNHDATYVKTVDGQTPSAGNVNVVHPAQSWTQITGKPTTFAPDIGTTSVTAKRGDYQPAWDDVTGKPTTFAPQLGTSGSVAAAGNDARLSNARTPVAHTHATTDLVDMTVVGHDVAVAASQAAARTAIGAGTSNLAIGATGSTAAAGNHDHNTLYPRTVNGEAPDVSGNIDVPPTAWDDVTGKPSTFTPSDHTHDWSTDVTGKPSTFTPSPHNHVANDISNASTVGKAVLTAADQASARTAIGAGTSNVALGATSSDAAAGDHLHDARYIRTINGVGPDGTGDVEVSGGGGGGSTSWADITGKPSTFAPTIGTTNVTAKAGDYQPAWLDVTDKPTTFDPTIGVTSSTAKAGDYQPGWDDVTDKPTTFPPTIGSSSTTAKAGDYTPAWNDLTGKPTTFAPIIGTSSVTAKAGDYQPDWDDVGDKPSTFTPSTHTHTATDVSDSTATGRAVLTAADEASARSAIGAGTSSLALGTSGSTAAAGNDARLSDERTPLDASVTVAKIDATGTASGSTYLRGDGAWAAAPAGPDATVSDKGAIQLAGDLSGTAAAPTVPGLTGKAPTSRTITAGTGLTGGGDLSADRTLAVSYGTSAGTATQGNDTRVVNAVQTTRSVSAGTGLTGGGDLTADRTLAVSYGTSAGTAAQGNDSRLSDTRTPTDNTVSLAKLTATGTASSSTYLRGDNTWATPSFTPSDATTGAKGVVQLAGDLAGTAALPTVPGLAAKAPTASPTFTGTVTTPAITVTGGTPGAGKVLTSDGSGAGTWEVNAAVPTTRTVTAGTGLTGGGDLSTDRSFAVSYGTGSGTAAQGNDSRIVNAVQTTRTISAGTGLSGGGDLTADRSLAVSYGTSSVTACVGNDARLSDTRTPTDGSVTIAKHSATGTPSSSTYLRGDGTWSTPTASVSDATTGAKGIVQLAGDLAGTAALPTVPGLAAKAPLASPTFTGSVTTPALQVTGGTPTVGKLLTADASGNATWQANAAVPTTRTVTAGTGLTGGGDLTADRTLTVAYGTSSTTACVGNDSRLTNTRTPTTGTVPYDLNYTSFGAGTTRVASSYGDYPMGIKLQRAVTFSSVTFRVNTADSTGNLTVELRKNGTQVSGTSTTIAAASQITGGTSTGTWAFSAGDILTVYVTAVGTTPGTGLVADITGLA